MKSTIMLVAFLIFPNVICNASDFSVSVKPKKQAYSIEKDTHSDNWTSNPNDLFKIRFDVKSVQDSVKMWVMGCSSYQHWESNNPKVKLVPWSCRKNVPVPYELTSRRSYSGELPIVLVGANPGEEIVFHLQFWAFKNIDMKESFEKTQSNEIKIKVVE